MCFNPRTHSGGDLRGISRVKTPLSFQSTHPLGGRQGFFGIRSGSTKFQSTHPLGGRHKVVYVDFMKYPVSIHAPTRGATAAYFRRLGWSVVSIHAPTRGATANRGHKCPAGVVSIHAPTRGATRLGFHYLSTTRFQSTHPLGGRLHIQ